MFSFSPKPLISLSVLILFYCIKKQKHLYIYFFIAIVCSVAVAFPKKLEESELNVYFLEDASGITADESSSFQDASVGADEGFSLESDASGLAADARPIEASDM